METSFNSNQMEKDFIELYKSGKLPFEKFDEYTKTLIKTSNEMHTREEETKQTISSNTAKNVEHMSEAAIEWSQTLRPVLAVALLLLKAVKNFTIKCVKSLKKTQTITQNST